MFLNTSCGPPPGHMVYTMLLRATGVLQAVGSMYAGAGPAQGQHIYLWPWQQVQSDRSAGTRMLLACLPRLAMAVRHFTTGQLLCSIQAVAWSALWQAYGSNGAMLQALCAGG